MPRIENWNIVNNRLVGNVFDHPLFSDGTEMMSSEIQSVDMDSGKVVTKNSVYDLGTKGVRPPDETI